MKIKIKEPNVLPKALTLNESNQLFKSAYKKISYTDKSSSAYLEAIRDIVVIELLFATGARVSEIADLKLNSVDLESGTISLYGKGRKQRMIKICNTECLDILIIYRDLYQRKINIANNYFLVNRLGNKLSDQSIRNLVRKLGVKAGIKKHLTPHVLRHTFATLLLEMDVDIKYIQMMLGHSSITTTQIYTHVSLEKQNRILADKHPRMSFAMNL